MSTASANGVPDLVKHMTISILEKGTNGNNKLEKFTNAFAIARGKLVGWGYLESSSAAGPVENIVLTRKGIIRNYKHAGEGGRKTDAFDRLFFDLQEADRMSDAENDVLSPPGSKERLSKPKTVVKTPTEKKLTPKNIPLAGRKLVTKARKALTPNAKKASARKSRAPAAKKARRA
jgi:hypothetical protein